MYQFEIWAPLATKMAVKINDTVRPLQGPDQDGWWRLEAHDAAHGSDYGYFVNDEEQCYPDPRSLSQPNGVHGLSRVYEHSRFNWNDAKFRPSPLASAIIYELHIGTFTPQGTLDAAINRLDYLAEFGVTHIELMPVASFAGNYGWGYDGVALFAVHHPYGGPDALKRFVNAAHERDLSVLLDVVYNHFGPVGNYTGKFGPYVTDLHHTPWGGAVNLEDGGSLQVRRFFCDNALMWLQDFHLDGLRLDAVHAFVDRSAIHFLEQLATETETLSAALGRRLVLIAESDLNDPRVVTPREASGFGFDAQWSDDFHHALFAVLSREPAGGYYADFGTLAQLAKALEQTFVYDGVFSQYRNRMHGRPTGNLPQHHFLGYIQNHDQIGNRAIGDRLTETVGFERAKIAAAVVLMSPFVPMIFQGEEWAASSPFQYFADHDDPEMAKLVSEGRKQEFSAFGWDPVSIPDPESYETFERSRLNWDEVTYGQHAEMRAWYRDLIQLRRSTPALNDGEPRHTRVSHDQQRGWFCMERGDIAMHCNLGETEYSFSVPNDAVVVFSSKGPLSVEDGAVDLPPDTVAIVKDLRTTRSGSRVTY